MIVIRNVFRLKFGAAKQAKALWAEGRKLLAQVDEGQSRALVDVTGPFYTFVLEESYSSLAAFETATSTVTANEEWKQWYARFSPLIESGYREIFSVVEA